MIVSALERQVSVKEVSLTSEIRTRRGGLTSASVDENSHEKKYSGDEWQHVHQRSSLLPSSVVVSPSSGLLVTEFFRA